MASTKAPEPFEPLPSGMLTVMFTDIVDSTRLNDIPDEKTASILSQLTRTRILEEGIVDDRLRYRLSIPLVQERFVRQNLYLKPFRYA